MKTLFLSIVLLSVLCSTNPVQSIFQDVNQVDSATVTFEFIAPGHCPDSLSRNPDFIDTVDTFLIYYGCSGVYKVLDSAGIDSIYKSFDIQLTKPETVILPIRTTIRFYWDVTVYFKNKYGSLNMNRIRHEYFYTVEKDDRVVIDGRY